MCTCWSVIALGGGVFTSHQATSSHPPLSGLPLAHIKLLSPVRPDQHFHLKQTVDLNLVSHLIDWRIWWLPFQMPITSNDFRCTCKVKFIFTTPCIISVLFNALILALCCILIHGVVLFFAKLHCSHHSCCSAARCSTGLILGFLCSSVLARMLSCSWWMSWTARSTSSHWLMWSHGDLKSNILLWSHSTQTWTCCTTRRNGWSNCAGWRRSNWLWNMDYCGFTLNFFAKNPTISKFHITLNLTRLAMAWHSLLLCLFHLLLLRFCSNSFCLFVYQLARLNGTYWCWKTHRTRHHFLLAWLHSASKAHLALLKEKIKLLIKCHVVHPVGLDSAHWPRKNQRCSSIKEETVLTSNLSCEQHALPFWVAFQRSSGKPQDRLCKLANLSMIRLAVHNFKSCQALVGIESVQDPRSVSHAPRPQSMVWADCNCKECIELPARPRIRWMAFSASACPCWYAEGVHACVLRPICCRDCTTKRCNWSTDGSLSHLNMTSFQPSVGQKAIIPLGAKSGCALLLMGTHPKKPVVPSTGTKEINASGSWLSSPAFVKK